MRKKPDLTTEEGRMSYLFELRQLEETLHNLQKAQEHIAAAEETVDEPIMDKLTDTLSPLNEAIRQLEIEVVEKSKLLHSHLPKWEPRLNQY